MPDYADLADPNIEATINLQVSKIRRNTPTAPAMNYDCPDCGHEIPEKRRALGYSICVDCQSMLEMRGKHRRRA